MVDSDGTMLGIVPTREALNKALSLNLDLVEMSSGQDIPVCKLLDFGKFRYESKKKKQQAKKKQKTIELKEIKLRPNISEHDLGVKIKHIRKFLQEGHKVKVTVRFRGREITHNELGIELTQKVLSEVEDLGKAEVEPKVEGRQVLMLLVAR